MKEMLRKNVLCILALLLMGGMSASGAVENYDFTSFDNNTFTASGTTSCDKVNNENMNLLQLGSETFNNRFAVSRAGTENASSAWVAKNWNDQIGLFTSYNARYFTILGLKNGDEITVTWTTGNAGTLRFFDAPSIEGKAAGDEVVNGTTYTVTTDAETVNVNLVADGDGTKTALYIKTVTIETGKTPVVVETGEAIYNFVVAESGTLAPTFGATVTSGGTEMQYLGTAETNFDNRFAVGPTNRNTGTDAGFMFRTNGAWKGLWSKNADRNFSILGLKKGDKVTLTLHTTDNNIKFVGGDAVVSGQEYTVEADGNMDFVSTGSVYIEQVKITTQPAEQTVKTVTTKNDYDFTGITADVINQDNDHTVSTGGNTLFLLAIDGNDFGNKFAIGPKSRIGTNGFYFRQASSTYKGLYSPYDNRNFSILNLKKGDKVTLTISNNAETLKFVGGDVVVSGQEYTAEADGNMDFVTTGSVYIEKVEITETREVEGLEVTIGVIGETPEAITYNLVKADEGATLAPTYGATVTTGGAGLQLISSGGDDFDGRFAVGPTNRNDGTSNGFIFRTSGNYKGLWSQYGSRNFSILDLKEGDKVAIIISNNAETLQFVGGSTVVSGQEYTVEADGNMDFVTTGGVYIEQVVITPAPAGKGESAGATLVSTKALDFTDATIRAYVATSAEGGTVTFQRVYKVAAYTPLFLLAAEGTDEVVTEVIPELKDDAETIETNLLKGSALYATRIASSTSTKYYVFGVLNDKAGFYPVGTLTSAAGKAYLELTSEQAAAAACIAIRFEDDSETTGISTAATKSATDDNAWYTLQGVHVAKPTHGIYVRNGKKVFIK